MNIPINKKIKVKKVSQVEEPDCPTPSFDNYVCGINNGDVSLPIEYELIGKTLHEVREGYSMVVAREERNGVKCLGTFTSSVIDRINFLSDGKWQINTKNSKYLVETI